jgi:hypothetical protein
MQVLEFWRMSRERGEVLAPVRSATFQGAAQASDGPWSNHCLRAHLGTMEPCLLGG